jgi:hypothetical protein
MSEIVRGAGGERGFGKSHFGTKTQGESRQTFAEIGIGKIVRVSKLLSH